MLYESTTDANDNEVGDDNEESDCNTTDTYPKSSAKRKWLGQTEFSLNKKCYQCQSDC